jgi:hypothetical protein
LILLRDPKGKFNDNGYYEINRTRDLFMKHRFFMKRKFVLNTLVGFLKEKEMLPAIIFVFSRKNVELCANEITTNLLEDDSKIPYIIRKECQQIIRKFPNFNEYLELPEYNELVRLLEKGIGIHHSGMIPVLREIVELMISKKYIKVVEISIDAGSKDTYENITRLNGDWDKLIENIKFLSTQNSIVHMTFSMVVSQYNYKEMLQLYNIISGIFKDSTVGFDIHYRQHVFWEIGKYTLKEVSDISVFEPMHPLFNDFILELKKICNLEKVNHNFHHLL